MEYIDYITLEDLRILAEKRAEYCTSIYMPTERMSKETRQNPIRLKNLIGKAEEELIALGMRRPEANAFLKPARDLLGESPFWQHQSDGLAMFVSPAGIRSFRLPVPFEEVVVVTDRFHLKPMLALFTADGRYYTLALSQNEVRLFHCTRYSANEVHVDGLPKSLAEVLKYDVFERELQWHTRTSSVQGASGGAPGRARSGRRQAMFHGHGGGATNDEKDAISRYFLQIDRHLQKILYKDQAPLVLAGVEFLFPIYRSVNTYQNLLDEGVEGNPEMLKPEELQRQAWALVESRFLKAQGDAAERFRQEFGTGHASIDVEAIVSAAAQGRVGILFVAAGKQVWGIYSADAGEAHVHETEEPGDEDLLDVAAIQTILNGGTVYAVKAEEVPGGGPAAVVFRY